VNDQQPTKVAIITGASKGFGKAAAASLLGAGWTVVGDARSKETLAATAAELAKSGSFLTVPGDVLDDDHLQELVARAESAGRFQLLVNNAGALGPSPLPGLAEVAIDDLRDLFWVNTAAPLRLIQIALPALSRSSGVVINLTSDAAAEAYEGWGAYGATKIALEKLTSVLAVEHPSIHFYSLDPGDMRTDMHQAAFPGEDISDRADPTTSAPAVLRLASAELASGRYSASQLV
jgi:NAD(P)-dependent dehydrogenase (short-subunit alcohol dehydrogenase family)